MFAKPEPIPETTPVVGITVAIEEVPDVQVPPDTVFPKAVVEPWQTTVVPEFVAGELRTLIDGVITGLLIHPEPE